MYSLIYSLTIKYIFIVIPWLLNRMDFTHLKKIKGKRAVNISMKTVQLGVVRADESEAKIELCYLIN